jgi:hypothetical protein
MVGSLKRSITEDKVANGYIFHGPKGCGKKLTAFIFAAALNCRSQGKEIPCEECSSCLKMKSGNHPNLELIKPSGSSIKIKQIRELISEFGDPEMLGVLIRRAKKRCRPWWQKAILRSLAAVGIMVLYTIICSAQLFFGRPTIKASFLELLNATVERGTDPCENAYIYYEKAGRLAKENTLDLMEMHKSWPGDFNETERKNLAGLLEENKPAIEMLREGSRRKLCWTIYDANIAKAEKQWRKDAVEVAKLTGSKLESSKNVNKMLLEPGGFYNPELQAIVTNEKLNFNKSRKLAFLMRLNTFYEAYTGDVNSAVRDCIIMHKAAEHRIAKGLLVEQMVAAAIAGMNIETAFRLMEKCNLDATNLLKLQQEFENSIVLRRPAIDLSGEKAAYIDIVQRCFTEDSSGDGRLLKQGFVLMYREGESAAGKLFTMQFPSRRETMQSIDKFFADAEARMRQTPWEIYKNSTEGKPGKWRGGEDTMTILATQAQAYDKTGQITWWMCCYCKAVITTAAILRYRAEKGELPNELEDLVRAGYVKKLEVDPYSGGALGYKRKGDTFVLYSPGPSFVDHGGKAGKKRMWSGIGDTIFWPIDSEK